MHDCTAHEPDVDVGSSTVTVTRPACASEHFIYDESNKTTGSACFRARHERNICMNNKQKKQVHKHKTQTHLNLNLKFFLTWFYGQSESPKTGTFT